MDVSRQECGQEASKFAKQSTRSIGAEKESLAEAFLREQGYRILERNFRCRLGEIDIIAIHQGMLVFVEVKYRARADYGQPSDAVNHNKQTRISNVASYYTFSHRQYASYTCRFDVVSIVGNDVRLYQNAFPYCGRYRH